MGSVAVLLAVAEAKDVRGESVEAPYDTYRNTIAHHASLLYHLPAWFPTIPVAIAAAEWRAGSDADYIDAVAAARRSTLLNSRSWTAWIPACPRRSCAGSTRRTRDRSVAGSPPVSTTWGPSRSATIGHVFAPFSMRVRCRGAADADAERVGTANARVDLPCPGPTLPLPTCWSGAAAGWPNGVAGLGLWAYIGCAIPITLSMGRLLRRLLREPLSFSPPNEPRRCLRGCGLRVRPGLDPARRQEAEPSRGSQSLFLLQEADTTHEWTDAEVASFLSCKPKAIPAPGSLPPATTAAAGAVALPLDAVAAKVAATLDKSVLLTLIETFEGVGQLPKDVDRQLLAGGRSAIRRDLGPTEKKSVRDLFVAMCRSRLDQ